MNVRSLNKKVLLRERKRHTARRAAQSSHTGFAILKGMPLNEISQGLVSYNVVNIVVVYGFKLHLLFTNKVNDLNRQIL